MSNSTGDEVITMSKFSLSIHSFTPPTLPGQPANIRAFPSDFRSITSPLLPSIMAATSPLLFAISVPSARTNDALYPATHLQITFSFEGTGEIFIPSVIASKDLTESISEDGETKLYRVEVPASDIPRPKVNHETTSMAEVSVYAWKREKLLGKWSVGQIEGLGIVGLKSEPLHLARQRVWKDGHRNTSK